MAEINYSNKNIGRRLRSFRLANKLTIRVLAHKAKVTEDTVWKLEAGDQKNPTIKTLIAFCKVLKIRIENFLV